MKKHYLLLIGVITLFCSSCSHVYYAPNTHNVPVFKEKNEVRLAGGVILGNATGGGEVQAAYAPTKNVGILANGTVINLDANKNGSDGRGFIGEVGAGYFKPFGPPNAKHLFVFEAYGVVGIGGCRGYYPNIETNSSSDTMRYGDLFYPNNYVTTRFVKAYVQPSITISHDIVDFSISAKIGMMHNYSVTNTIPDSLINTLALFPPPGNGTLHDDLGILNYTKTSVIFEPAFTLRIGFKYVKAQVQYTISVPTNNYLKELANKGMFSAGISIDIAPRFKKYGWKLTPMDEGL